MEEDCAPTAASAIDALSASSARLFQTLTDLQDKTSQTATRSTAVAKRLSAARSTLITISAEGEALRTTHEILAELDAVRTVLGGGGTASLRRCIPMLEGVRQRSGEAASARASAELASVLQALCSAFEAECQAWTRSGGEVLFHGARALALAPPGGLSAGVDGLERERAALSEARELLVSAERIDALSLACSSAAGSGTAKRGDQGDDAHSSSSLVATCHALFRADADARVTAELQAANRLAAHATSAGSSDESDALLQAVAEAAATAARAARAIASLYGLLPSPDDPSVPVDSGGSAEAASASEFATATDAILAKLRSAPKDGGRPAALKAIGVDACELLRRELEASHRLVAAAHSIRGRRALGVLGEAGERLAEAALGLAEGGDLQ